MCPCVDEGWRSVCSELCSESVFWILSFDGVAHVYWPLTLGPLIDY